MTRALVFVACACISTALAAGGYLEDKDHLAKHQNAWRAIKSMREMYLYQRSYEKAVIFEKDSYCIRAYILANDSETHTATETFRFVVNKKDHIEEGVVEYFKVLNTTDPKSRRVLYFTGGKGDPAKPIELPVAFTNYKSCLILRVPKAEEGGAQNACQMWVDKAHIVKPSACCQFIYDLLCGPTTHVIYDKTQCAREDAVDPLVEA
uniref:Salivary lipocalin n=1 Tax=Ornithodoros coriaceus TaxID=92741 RepID=B2D2A7_ORNCO|nr:salivary lipocalin [Ornithodoros coriaceus]